MNYLFYFICNKYIVFYNNLIISSIMIMMELKLEYTFFNLLKVPICTEKYLEMSN